MKKVMLIACGILMLLMFQNTQAQNSVSYIMGLQGPTDMRDTLVVKLSGSDKIMIIGKDLKMISTYENADSIKTLFITDWDKAIKGQTVSISSKVVHYFVHPSGKRRMKTESEDYVEPAIDVTNEITRLNLDLPSYQYFIHDLISGMEIQVYLQKPDNLIEMLGGISLNDAIHTIAPNKKDIKKNYKMELTAKDNSYTLSGMEGNRLDGIEMTPVIGIGVLGTQVCPVFGGDIYISLANKYRIPKVKAGIELVAFGLAEMNQSDLVNISGIAMLDARCAINLNAGNKKAGAHWLGLTAGIVKAHGSLDNAFKFGAFSEGAGPFNYGIDFIPYNGKYLSAVKLVFPF